MPAPLLLADAPWLLYRAFYSLPDSITGAAGRPVNALLGATNAVLQVVEVHSPRAVVMCMGQESAHYRTAAYPPYHANRPPAPDDLAWQWERAGDLWEALGWYVLGSEDHEADDLMGTLARREAQAGGRALIFSGDRDMYQCVGERVSVLAGGPKGGPPDEIDPAGVRERYGIDPEQVPDFIALRGDPSDSLPGAKGIGAKTAAELLRRHATLEEAIAGAIREKPSVRRALLEQDAELRVFKDIATLRTLDLDPVRDRTTDRNGGAAAAAGLGMRRLAERLQAPAD